jgi:hypothetical protein
VALNRRSESEFYVWDFFNRPANVTAYATGDILSDGTSLVFADATTTFGHGGEIRSALVAVGANVASGLPTMRLWLFDADPTLTTLTDNIALAIADGDFFDILGVIDFGVSSQAVANPAAGTAGNVLLSVQNLSIGFDDDGAGNIYGILEMRSAYIPTNGEGYKVQLGIKAY